MAGALEGVRILDCTQIIAGPLAASLLSEMGADVVKIEPLEGEPWRLQAELIPKESRSYMTQNRGKRCLAINLKHPGSDPLRIALIGWADVLITNYRPGVPEELKLDYETAKAIKPDIIYCESTAFGKQGPDANLRGYDIVAQAMSGLTASNGNVNNGLPQQIGFAPADVITGYAMAWGITAALYHHARTGEGQAVNASLLHTALTIQAGSREIVALDSESRQQSLATLKAARERGATIEEILAERRAKATELSGNIYYRSYKTKDSYLVVGCLGPGPRARFRKALNIRDERYEEGFDRTPEAFRRVGTALVAKCEAILASKTNAEWMEFFHANDIAAGPVRFVDELMDDPQVIANNYMTEYEHTLLGTLRGPSPVISMSGTPTRVQRASPALGEHSDEVLAELGFSTDAVSQLRTSCVVG
jgi:crotonobetainyl-CoA:carnitine CoA-transferase CaiB-like acyl-CoA transferase